MNFPAALTATALYKYLISIPAAGLATVLLLQKAVNLINAQHADLVLLQVTWSITWQRNWTNLSLF